MDRNIHITNDEKRKISFLLTEACWACTWWRQINDDKHYQHRIYYTNFSLKLPWRPHNESTQVFGCYKWKNTPGREMFVMAFIFYPKDLLCLKYLSYYSNFVILLSINLFKFQNRHFQIAYSIYYFILSIE